MPPYHDWIDSEHHCIDTANTPAPGVERAEGHTQGSGVTLVAQSAVPRRGASRVHRQLHTQRLGGLQRERNVLFNDALNTFYIRLYGRERNVLFNDALNTFYPWLYGRERNVLFNDALNTFYIRLYGRERQMFYLTMHSTHVIYGYMGERDKCFI